MEFRLPSVRDPQSFYDVYAVTVIGTVVMAIVLHIWHGSFVRIEMLAFVGVVFLWAGWATSAFSASTSRSRRSGRPSAVNSEYSSPYRNPVCCPIRIPYVRFTREPRRMGSRQPCWIEIIHNPP